MNSNPSSSLRRNWIHDVFPSFHGADVRRSFLSHTLKELRSKGIDLFIDNDIVRGNFIGPSLVEAIRGSRIAIVLLSSNYASSSWCLDELAEIMKCKEDFGQTVMAIFYEVNPTDVNKQTGGFGEVFTKTCEGKTAEDIEKWSQALAKVATVAGYHSSNWATETEMIEEIATHVSNELTNNSTPSRDFDGFIGMGSHMENMKQLLCLDSNEVRMIGIWGPPGIGKTTIARCLFNQLCGNFGLSVFMENIKAMYTIPICSDDYSAKLDLQQKFMSQIINERDIKIPHLGVAQERLNDKKVLVVLDGVDQLFQLEAMAKETRWFGHGSRIIITTQDLKLLKAHGINHIYKVDFPPHDEALEIFCMYAFEQKSPKDGFEMLAWEATVLACQLPLGLRVLGSYFRGKYLKKMWEEALPELRSHLDEEIETVLKFSYDALSEKDKSLFLHLTCFFNFGSIENIEIYLAKTFSDFRQRLDVLVEKFLISIVSGYLEINRLLVQLGREIVRKKYGSELSIREPGKRQFLVDARDICEVLSDDTAGSSTVIGIDLTFSGIDDEDEEFYISERAFEKMSNLQFLKISGDCNRLYFPPRLSSISRKLILLSWGQFPMTCLPSNFNPQSLVNLTMTRSKLEKLWDGNKPLRNLKRMDLESSIDLKELPDLSTATNLETLNLGICSSLVKLPDLSTATSLKTLLLNDCSSLVELPSFPGIANATNLKSLSLRGCSSLVGLPSSIGNATNLEDLVLHGCSNLVELPSSIGNLHKLLRLNMERCSKLEVLPININMESLDGLHLHNCSLLKTFPEISTNIKYLHLTGTAVEELPLGIRSWSRLEEYLFKTFPNFTQGIENLVDKSLISIVTGYIEINSLIIQLGREIVLRKYGGSGPCIREPGKRQFLVDERDICEVLSDDTGGKSVIGIDLSLSKTEDEEFYISERAFERMSNLQFLRIGGDCNRLYFPPSFNSLSRRLILLAWDQFPMTCLPSNFNPQSLVTLSMLRSKLEKLWDGNKPLKNLKTMNLGSKDLKELPDLSTATNLETLTLGGCSSLVKLPDLSTATSLKTLNLYYCSSLVELPSLGNATNLVTLSLNYCSSLVELSSVGNATNLTNLSLKGCSSLVHLPSSIGNATNLKELVLDDCSNLVELPSSIGNLHKLLRLNMERCSKLEVLPININMESLDGLHLHNCSLLKTFPEISTNIKYLHLTGTAVEELPLGIRSWSRLEELHMSYCENLKDSPHALDSITDLHFPDTEIKELGPWVKGFSRLRRLLLKGLQKLVSLPQLPDSLLFLDAENCGSLERLDCSFHNPDMSLNFYNCFKLNQEARDLIIQASNHPVAVVPGGEVPSYFRDRATGGTVTVKLNERPPHKPLRFKACIMLVDNVDNPPLGFVYSMYVSYKIMDKQNGVIVPCPPGHLPLPRAVTFIGHLYTFDLEVDVTSNELCFELTVSAKEWDVKECGLLQLS